MRWHDALRSALAPMLLAGCASSSIDLAPAAPDRPWRPATDATGEAKLAMLRGLLQEFGRDPTAFGIEAWVRAVRFDPDAWAADVAAWKRLGARIVMLYPTYDLPDFASQIELLRRFKDIARA